MMGFGYGMGSWGGIGSLLFLVLIVLGVIYLWRAVNPARHDSPPHDTSSRTNPPSEDSALRILRERYARGEIDQEEYERRKAGLA